MEQLILERLHRAERLLATQRRHVCQLEARGLDGAQAQSLLALMESVTDQFYLTWRLFRAYRRPAISSDPAPPPAPAEARPAAAPPALPSAAVAAASHVPCPHCGLGLGLKGRDGAISYDISEWQRRCRHQELQTPVLCQLLPLATQTVH
jgi:hypothetical protein